MTRKTASPMTTKVRTNPAARAAPGKAAAALLARADAYAKSAGRTRSTVSMYLFNDGKVLDSIARGGDVMSRALERAHDELDRRQAMVDQPKPRAVAQRAHRQPKARAKAATKKIAKPARRNIALTER